MAIRKLIILLTLPLLFLSCDKAALKKTINPKDVDFVAEYDTDFNNILYPSMLLAMSSYGGNVEKPLFSVSVTAPKNNSVLRIVADSSVLNYVSITQETLLRKGIRYTYEPVIKWKYENIYRLRQQGYVDITFTCYINDEEVDVKNIRLNYRPINECLLSLMGKDGTYRDYRWLFAAYVNEDHPMIDGMLREILSQGMVTKFDGSSNEKKVDSQMRAIWYYALNRGLAYSSISCTSNGSKSSNSQHIRFFGDVYKNRQANCIDACVFFSSIMRKIGLYPIIFVEPCHAFLGYYTDKTKKKIALLETTITGWVNMPEFESHFSSENNQFDEDYYNKISKYLTDKQKNDYQEGKMDLEQIKKAISNNLFDKAASYQAENYKSNKNLYSDTTQPAYQMLVIEELRKQISPIPADDNF
jgi:hypothetical protein